jgi:membrane protein
VRWGERRLEHHASGRLGSLVFGCLRRTTESSRNSGSALVLNVFLATVPALLAVYALADRASKHVDSVARHLVVDLHLHGSSAKLVLGAFGTVSANAAAVSVFGVVSFLIFGLAVGKVLQDVYARAWRVQVSSIVAQWRYAIWFIASTFLLGLQMAEEALVSAFGRELLVPVWLMTLTVFWVWTPWFLLQRRIEWRLHVPGAVLIAVAYTLSMIASQFVLATWIDENGRFFGSIGIALALLCWGEVLAGIWLAGAVFSPVYTEWRVGWKREGTSPFAYREHAAAQAEN